MKIGKLVGFEVYYMYNLTHLINDLEWPKKTAKLWLYVYQMKARNPGNLKIEIKYK